jgi:hypothetical protein
LICPAVRVAPVRPRSACIVFHPCPVSAQLSSGADKQLRAITHIVNRLAVDADGADGARAILRCASRLAHPQAEATALVLQLLPISSHPLLIVDFVTHVCSGAPAEVALVLESYRELLRGGGGGGGGGAMCGAGGGLVGGLAVPLLGSLADMRLPRAYQRDVFELVREALEVEQHTEYPGAAVCCVFEWRVVLQPLVPFRLKAMR